MFFAFGLLLRRSSLLSVIHKKKYLVFWLLLPLFFVMIFVYYQHCEARDTIPAYTHWISLPYEMLAFFLFLSLSMILAPHAPGLLVDVGRNSYILYFTHMQIGMNIINLLFFYIWERSTIAALAILPFRPVLIVAVSYLLFVVLGKRLARLLRLEKCLWIVGL